MGVTATAGSGVGKDSCWETGEAMNAPSRRVLACARLLGYYSQPPLQLHQEIGEIVQLSRIRSSYD